MGNYYKNSLMSAKGYYCDKEWLQKISFLRIWNIITILESYYSEGKTIYPDKDNIFNALNITKYKDIKVVILGQDPYHNEGEANGLAFSVNNGVKLPPSLKNIFKELQNDIGGGLRTNGDLSDWAKQGVLLLNTALTVFENEPNSMKDLWKDFTSETISLINKKENPVVFVLWGSNAQKYEKYIDNSKHYVIKSAHPSPLSAYRGFFGSKPFSKINDFLIKNGYDEIIWS